MVAGTERSIDRYIERMNHSHLLLGCFFFFFFVFG